MSISLTSVILVCSLSFSLRCKSSFSGSTAGAACWLLLLCSSSTIEKCHHVVLCEPAMARCFTTAVTTHQQYGKNSYCIHKLLVVLIKQTCHRPYRTCLQEWPVFPLLEDTFIDYSKVLVDCDNIAVFFYSVKLLCSHFPMQNESSDHSRSVCH